MTELLLSKGGANVSPIFSIQLNSTHYLSVQDDAVYVIDRCEIAVVLLSFHEPLITTQTVFGLLPVCGFLPSNLVRSAEKPAIIILLKALSFPSGPRTLVNC